MANKYYFISDIHLGLLSKEIENKKERKLVEFLYSIKNDAKELYINGDLFDYWFEYKRVYQKGFFRTLTALQDLSENGVVIHYIIGNHDFMHKDFFTNEIGVKLYEDPFTVNIEGKVFFIGHGDGMMKGDTGYKILKSVFRNKFFQGLYSLIHPDLGIKIASGTSKSSREYTSAKNFSEDKGMFEAAKLEIDKGADFVILGHSHKRSFMNYKNGIYINLGTWLEQPCYGLFTENKFEIINW